MLSQRRQSAVGIPIRHPVTQTITATQFTRPAVQSGRSVIDGLKRQIQQEESTKLYPRLAMFEALAGFDDEHKRRPFSGDATCEARRDFLDSFAYLCDVQKGGGTTTAAALQRLQSGNVLWLAANEGISDSVLVYANDILAKLRTATLGNQVDVQNSVFALAVDRCEARIRFYKNEVQRYALHCRMTLRHKVRDDAVNALRAKLKRLSEPRANLTVKDYIDLCYEMRKLEINHIKRHRADPKDDFSRLSHYIRRLGETRSAANTVVDAMFKVPSLRVISDIKRVSAPEPIVKTIDSDCLNPLEVLYGIIADSASYNPSQIGNAFARLLQLDPSSNRRIHKAMITRQRIVTRVHAELQIADKFSRNRDVNFADDDKYIGCSKSACYFCFQWLSSHHHVYVPPATHCKIIPGCRGPDSDLNQTGAGVLLDTYSKIYRRIGQDIFGFLQGNAQRIRQYMSTEASSRAPSHILSASVYRDDYTR